MTDEVPCGKCHECLATRRNTWAFRLYHHMQVSESACFMTLTYGRVHERGRYLYGIDPPLSFNGHETLCKKDLQDFFKRLRKRNQGKIKYYACGEYGSKFKRPHYHIIMFGLDRFLLQNSLLVSSKIWKMGSIDIAACNMPTINYTVGYIMKGLWQPEQDDDDRQPEFSVMSKNLGLNYLTPALWDYHVNNMVGHVTLPNGALMTMPRYYKDRIFTKDERKELNEFNHMLRNLNFDFIGSDTDVMKRNNSIRRHQKEQILKRVKF